MSILAYPAPVFVHNVYNVRLIVYFVVLIIYSFPAKSFNVHGGGVTLSTLGYSKL